MSSVPSTSAPRRKSSSCSAFRATSLFAFFAAALTAFLWAGGVPALAHAGVFYGKVTQVSPRDLRVRDPYSGRTMTFAYTKSSFRHYYEVEHGADFFVHRGSVVKVNYVTNRSGKPDATIILMLSRMPSKHDLQVNALRRP